MSQSDRPLRYTHEELVTISKSPLCKPPDFELPCKEWIGAEYLSGRSKKSSKIHDMDHVKADFDNNHDKNLYPKSPTSRASKLKSGSDKSGTFKDSIVLGPPKMSFASSSAQSVRNRDLDAEITENKNNNSRSNSNSGLTSSPYRSGARASSQVSGAPPRESMKDGDGWVSVPSKGARKSSFASSDEEGKHRDLFRARERLGPHAKRTEGREAFERAETSHDNATREWRRGKNALVDAKPTATAKAGNRAPKARNNTSNFKVIDEQDPEWLNEDSLDTIEDPLATGSAGPGHTVQDFEAWKAQMRAQQESPKETVDNTMIEEIETQEAGFFAEQESTSVSIEETSNTRSSFSSKKVDVDRLFIAGPSTSSFTSKLTHPNEDRLAEARIMSGSPATANLVQPMPAGRASRFSTFFRSDSSQTVPSGNTSQPKDGDSRPESISPGLKSSRPDSKASKEDKEGFNRIMAMLGKNPSAPNTVSSSAAATIGSSRGSTASPPTHIKSAESQFFQSLQDKGVAKTPEPRPQEMVSDPNSSKVEKDKNFLFSLMGKGGAKAEVSPEKPSVLSPGMYGGPPGLGPPLPRGTYNEGNRPPPPQQSMPLPFEFQNMPPPSLDGVPQWANANEPPFMGSSLRGGPPPPGVFMSAPYAGRPSDMTYPPQGNTAPPPGFGPSRIPPGLGPPPGIQAGAPEARPPGFYPYGAGAMPPANGSGHYPYGAPPPPPASTAANNYGGRQ